MLRLLVLLVLVLVACREPSTRCPPNASFDDDADACICNSGFMLEGAVGARECVPADGGVEDGGADDAGTMGVDAASGDGGADACVPRTFYRDADGDGRGDPDDTTDACTAPPGHVDNSDDCDDTCATCFDGASETCNGEDDDCDGLFDEGLLAFGTPRVLAPDSGSGLEMTSSDDGYVVVWELPEGVFGAGEMAYETFDRDGFSTSAGRTIFTDFAATTTFLDATVRRGEEPVLVIALRENPGRSMVHVIPLDGRPPFEPVQLDDRGAALDLLRLTSDGTSVVVTSVWNQNGVLAQAVDVDDNTLGAPTTVYGRAMGDGRADSYFESFGIDVLANPAVPGEFVVASLDRRGHEQDDVYLARFMVDGESIVPAVSRVGLGYRDADATLPRLVHLGDGEFGATFTTLDDLFEDVRTSLFASPSMSPTPLSPAGLVVVSEGNEALAIEARDVRLRQFGSSRIDEVAVRVGRSGDTGLNAVFSRIDGQHAAVVARSDGDPRLRFWPLECEE